MVDAKRLIETFWRLDDRLAHGGPVAPDDVQTALDVLIDDDFVLSGEGYTLDAMAFRRTFAANVVLYKSVTTSFEDLILEEDRVGFHLRRTIVFAQGACFPGTNHGVAGRSVSFGMLGIAQTRAGRIARVVLRTDNLRGLLGVPDAKP